MSTSYRYGPLRDKSVRGFAPHLAAMDFGEIGRREGITRGGAFMAYRSAILKLRRHPSQLLVLGELAEALQLSRDRRIDADPNR